MKNTTYLILVLGIVLAITIMTSIDQSDASPAPEPKRRKSGGSRKSSSGTSWWGGSNKQKNSGTSYSFIVGNKRMIEYLPLCTQFSNVYNAIEFQDMEIQDMETQDMATPAMETITSPRKKVKQSRH